MQLDINLAEQTSPDNLPNQTKNQMLSDLDDISTANVDDGAANTLRRLDDDVVVFCKVEVVQRLELLAGLVEYTLVNCVGYAVVDELGEHQAIFTGIEHLESVGREGQKVPNIGVSGQDSIDMAGELGSLIFIDCVCDVGGGALDLDSATTRADAAFGGMAGLCCWTARSCSTTSATTACVHSLLRGRGLPEFGDEIYVIIQLHSPRAIQLDLFEGLAHNIVGLVLGLLCCLDDGGLVNVALVVDVELAEGVLQAEDLALIELGIFSAHNGGLAVSGMGRRRGAVRARARAYFCSLMMFMMTSVCELERDGEEALYERPRCLPGSAAS